MGYNKNDFEGSTSFLTGAELLLHDKSEMAHPHILQLIAKLNSANESAELKKNKNVPGGYAGLDGAGRVLHDILPEITGSLIGKGAITEEKLSEGVLDKLSGFVKKEDGKVLSDNNFSDENLEAVLKVGSLDKSVAQIIANYVARNTFNEHVQDTDMHVSAAVLDNAFKKIEETLTDLEERKADAPRVVDLENDLWSHKRELDYLSENKVDKVKGKDLSTNDFTDDDKESLGFALGISLRINLANKEDGKWLSKNDYTDEDKQKVDAIPKPDTLITTEELNEAIQQAIIESWEVPV